MSLSSQCIRITYACLLGGLGSACAVPSSNPPAPVAGELGHGNFAYQCLSPLDSSCWSTCKTTTCSDTATLGRQKGAWAEAIAVGATFSMLYNATGTPDGLPSPFRLMAAAPDITPVENGAFQSKREGTFAFLAEDNSGHVTEFLHVTFESPARAAFENNGVPQSSLEVAMGETQSLRIAIVSKTERVLGGTLPLTVTAAPSTLARALLSRDTGILTLEGVHAGTGSLHVAANDWSQDIVLTVREAT